MTERVDLVGWRSPTLHTTRNWVNCISGWFSAIFFTAMIVGVDIFGVYKRWSDGGQGFDAWGIALYCEGVLISLGAVAVFSRPRVEVKREGMLVRGVLKDRWVPWSRVEGVDSSGKYVRVETSEGSFSIAGAERANWELMTGRPSRVAREILAGQARAEGERAESEEDATGSLESEGSTGEGERSTGGVEGDSPGDGGEVVVRWRSVSVPEWILLGVWVGYLMAGIVRSVA